MEVGRQETDIEAILNSKTEAKDREID